MGIFSERLTGPLVGLPRFAKRMIVIGLDMGLSLLTVWIAYYLRLGEWVYLSKEGILAAVASFGAIPIFAMFGLYRAVFRFVSWDAIIAISRAVTVYGIIYAAYFTAYGISGVPRTVGIIQPILMLIAVASSRAFGRFWLTGGSRRRAAASNRKNVLVYGAGSAGRQLAAAIKDSSELQMVGFVDDDPGLARSIIGGQRVWPSTGLAKLIEKLEVQEVHLAIPSANRQRRNEILAALRAQRAAVRTLPGLLDLAHGKVTVTDVKPLPVDDLLGRDTVQPDKALMEQAIRGKVVLVTGAGGSIGSELARQIFALKPRTILLLDSSEFALYSIHSALASEAEEADSGSAQVIPLLASVCDVDRLHGIFEAWRPQTVYHAAAYKHVPLVEQNVVDGVRNNVIGTLTTATCAREFGTERFILVSTDKAVRPTNVMGASKRMAELVLQALATQGQSPCFAMVRFGNVLDSSGSVVPLFRRQIRSGGPVTVTDPEVTRYFMTIPEAAQLVLQAGAMASGGDVFVLDMGESVKIVDLARRMIELSGLRVRSPENPDGDIEIVFTGLRPGEKLYEELLIGDNPVPTTHPRVMMAVEDHIPMGELERHLAALTAALNAQDPVAVRRQLQDLVPEFVPQSDLVDLQACKIGTHSSEQETVGAKRVVPFLRAAAKPAR